MSRAKVLLCVLCAVVCAGRLPAQEPQGSSPLSAMLPGLKDAPAPAWVKPGVRLTYYSSAASVPGRSHYFYRDEDGDWVDDSGNRFRRDEEPGPAGHGLTQLTIARVNRQSVALSATSYGYTNGNGPLTLLSVAGSVGLPAAGSDWWCHPDELKKLVGTNEAGTIVVRMPYPIQNKTYQAIRIQYNAPGARHAYVYDEETGVLLSTSSSVVSPDGRRTMLSANSFRGMRALDLPWTGMEAPDWAGQVRGMQYQGRQTLFVPGGPPTSLPMTVEVQVKARGEGWLRFSQTAKVGGVMGMPPATNTLERVTGTAQIGGLWVPPAALARLRQEQELDKDPLSGYTTRVSYRGPNPAGDQVVTISQANRIQQLDYVYSVQTGMLLAYGNTDRSLNTRTQIQLAGTH